MAVVLLLPTGVRLAHSLQGHQHPACTEFKTHIHKKELDCSLCYYQISVFDFTPDSFDELFFPVENLKSDFNIVENVFVSSINITSLRGPPCLV